MGDTIVDQELGNEEAFTKQKPKTGQNRNNLTTAMTSGNAPGTRAGFMRPETQSRMMTASGNRTAKTARPVTGMTGRAVRMKTAAAAQENDPQEFIDTTRLDPQRYGSDFHYAPIMFEYLLCHQPDTRFALQLANAASQSDNYQQDYWRTGVGKCYLRMGMLRKAEAEFTLAKMTNLEAVLLLAKVYQKLFQPLSAIALLESALKQWPENVNILTQLARIYTTEVEISSKSVEFYRKVLNIDRVNVEALASLAQEYFYHDHPKIALKMYQQLLSQGNFSEVIVENQVQIFNNIGLCCYYIQKPGLGITALRQALQLCQDEEEMTDIWYNVGVLAPSSGQPLLAKQAYQMAITISNERHVQAINNLGVIEFKGGKLEIAVGRLEQAQSLVESQEMFVHEVSYNLGCVKEGRGEFSEAWKSFNKSLEIWPENTKAQRRLNVLADQF